MIKVYKQNMMNLLWISSCPPTNIGTAAGGKTFSYYFQMVSCDAEINIHLVSLATTMKEEDIEPLFSHITHKFIFSDHSLFGWVRKISNLDSKLNPFSKLCGLISNRGADQIVGFCKQEYSRFEPDIIVFEWTNTLIIAPIIHKIFPNAKLVASEHDVTFVGYERRASFFRGMKGLVWKVKAWNEKRRELEALGLCSLICPHNPDNMIALEAEGIKREKMQWLVPYYHDLSVCKRQSNGRDIMFFGAMGRPENYLSAIWFIDNVMSLLEDLDIRFVIVGSKPPKELLDLANERIVVTGYVEDEMPYFEQSLCFVAPMVLGAGIKVKVIEAISSMIPVLTNQIGIEGIAQPGDDGYFYCETPQQYASVIHQLVNGTVDIESLNAAAKLIMKKFSLQESADAYIQRLKRLINDDV